VYDNPIPIRFLAYIDWLDSSPTFRYEMTQELTVLGNQGC
jgi:hypothetical protein